MRKIILVGVIFVGFILLRARISSFPIRVGEARVSRTISIQADGNISALTTPVSPADHIISTLCEHARALPTISSETAPNYNWPMLGHDASRSGYSGSPSPKTNNTLWNCSLGGWVLSPAVAYGIVFVGGWFGAGNNVYALNATTGEVKWSVGGLTSVSSCPAVADGAVFVTSDYRLVYAFNLTTGSQLWNFTTAGKYIESSPAVVDGMVFFKTTYKSTDTIYALNETTGHQIWNYTMGSYANNRCSPAVAGGMVFIGTDYGNIYALNATTGDKIWNYTTGGVVRGTPAVADGVVFFGSSDQAVYALNATTGSRIWCYVTDGRLLSSPAVADGAVFIGSNDGNLYAFGDARSIRIVDVTVSSSQVYEGDIVDITVGIVNHGAVSENFNVTAFYGNVTIETRTGISLDPDWTTSITFDWNTSGAPGNHRISADATIVPGEIDTLDNVFVDGVVEVIARIDEPIGGGGTTIIEGNVTITQAVVTKNTLHFKASGPSGSTGWINVTFPMVNTTNIKIFNKPPFDPGFPIITSNGTHYFIYFEFSLSTHEIMLIYADVDIALTGVDLWKAIVGENNPCKFNVTLSNQGDNEEVFNITLFGNGDIIGVIWNVTLSSGNTTTITFEWDVASFLKGNYSISANITTVLLGELDITNNNLTGGWLLVTFPGDVDGDRDVDIFDIVKMALIYDVAKPDPLYDPNCDLEDDGDIDIFDIVAAASHYGESWQLS